MGAAGLIGGFNCYVQLLLGTGGALRMGENKWDDLCLEVTAGQHWTRGGLENKALGRVCRRLIMG